MKIVLLFFFWLSSIYISFGQDFLDSGKAHIHAAEYDLALLEFRNQLDSCQNTCHDSIRAYIHVYLGKSFQLLNKYDSALQNYIRGNELFRAHDADDGLVFGLASLAEFYRNLMQYDKAFNYLEEAERLFDKHKISDAKMAYLYNRYAAVVNESSYDFDRVIGYSQKVLDLARKMGDRDLEASSLNEIGFAYEKKGDLRATEHFILAFELYKKLGNNRYAVAVLTNAARSLTKLGKFNESQKYIDQGLEMCRGKSWVRAEPFLYWHTYLNAKGLGEVDQALEAHEKYHKVQLKSQELEWNKSMYQIEAKYELSEKEKELAEVQHSEELAQIESVQKSKQVNNLILVGFLLIIIILLLYLAYYKSKKSNRILNESVEQKELMMNEIHHRVKNNLTFLKSMLYLKAIDTNDQQVKLILDECQARIHSMALVHQNLYDMDNVTQIDFKLFLDEMLVQLDSMFDKSKGHVSVEMHIDNVLIEMKLAVFLGLILNELVTNSYKYAFENKAGKIIINMNQDESNLIINYADNGKGLPEGYDIDHSSGFGFRLIKILTNQIDGNLTYDYNGLSMFTLMIPR